MDKKETPEERRERLKKQLEKARRISAEKRERRKRAIEVGDLETAEKLAPKPKQKSLAKVIREILDDDEIVDKVIQNQPEYWTKLPYKNPNYIIATVMAVKAMGGDQKAADFLAKRGWGDKVVVDSADGFFDKKEFTIKVIPSRTVDAESIDSQDVIDGEIKQIEE